MIQSKTNTYILSSGLEGPQQYERDAGPDLGGCLSPEGNAGGPEQPAYAGCRGSAWERCCQRVRWRRWNATR